MKNKGFNFLLLFSVVLFIVDVVTTLWYPSLMVYLETNPIYRATGTIIPIVLLNVTIFVMIFLGYNYKRTGNIVRYLCINALVWLNLARGLALKNNIHWVRNPIEAKAFAVAAQTDPVMLAETIKATQMEIAIQVVPVFIGIIVFLIWYLDHKVEWREE